MEFFLWNICSVRCLFQKKSTLLKWELLEIIPIFKRKKSVAIDQTIAIFKSYIRLVLSAAFLLLRFTYVRSGVGQKFHIFLWDADKMESNKVIEIEWKRNRLTHIQFDYILVLNAITRTLAVTGQHTYNNNVYRIVVSIIVRINSNTILYILNFMRYQVHEKVVERSQQNWRERWKRIESGKVNCIE